MALATPSTSDIIYDARIDRHTFPNMPADEAIRFIGEETGQTHESIMAALDQGTDTFATTDGHTLTLRVKTAQQQTQQLIDEIISADERGMYAAQEEQLTEQWAYLEAAAAQPVAATTESSRIRIAA